MVGDKTWITTGAGLEGTFTQGIVSGVRQDLPKKNAVS